MPIIVENTLTLRDRVSAVMRRITANTRQAMDNVSRATQNAAKGMVVLNQSVELIGRAISGLSNVANVADSYVLITSRIENMTRAGEDAVNNQQMILDAANRTRTGFNQMAEFITKVGTASGKTFGSTAEIVRFSELLTKAAAAEGYSGAGFDAAMTQLTQGLASGTLRGEELNSVLEQAAPIARRVAESMGMNTGQLREYASQGKLTAEQVKNAMFSQAESIEASFKKMPATFGGVMTVIKNNAMAAFQPVIEKLSAWLNSQQFQAFANNAVIAITMVADAVSWLIDVIGQIATWVQSNWSIIAPILTAVAIAVGVTLVTAWLAAAAASLAANWPIYAIIAAIGLVIWIAQEMGASLGDIVGFVAGLFMGLYALLMNYVIVPIWNQFAAFAEFFANVFNEPVYSVKKLFVNFANSILDHVKGIAEAMDWVFGSNMSGRISDLQTSMMNMLGEVPEGYKVIERLEAVDYAASVNQGLEFGKKFDTGLDSLGDKIKALKAGATGEDAALGSFSAGATQPNIGKVGEVGKINSDVTIADEDLKFMRDVARTKFVNEFKTLRPTVHATFGDVRETADVKSIMSSIADAVDQAVASSLL